MAADQVVVCEGYTDVIGFMQAGVPRAVATCGTALTEEHVRLLKRFARRVVLAFDADEAGQGAAARFYEWEKKYEVEVSVAAHAGRHRSRPSWPRTDPAALAAAVEQAVPFLRFRLDRVFRRGLAAHARGQGQAGRGGAGRGARAPRRERAAALRRRGGGPDRAAGRRPGAGRSAGGGRSRVDAAAQAARRRESAEAVALALLVHRWDDIAPWLVEALFVDEQHLATFRALADAHGDARKAIELADPATREELERLAVDRRRRGSRSPRPLPHRRGRQAAAGRPCGATSRRPASTLGCKVLVEQLDDPEAGPAAAEQLLTWLDRRTEERE